MEVNYDKLRDIVCFDDKLDGFSDIWSCLGT